MDEYYLPKPRGRSGHGRGVPVSVRVTEFLVYCEVNGLSTKTIAHYGAILKQYYTHLKDKGVRSWEDPAAPRSYLAHLRSKRLADATIHVRYGILDTFYGFLLNEGKVSESPMRFIPKPRPKKKYPQTLTDEQIRKLLGAKGQHAFEAYRDRFIVYLLLGTGIRREELMNLTIQDIDIFNHTVHIRQGKGGKDRVIPMGLSLSDEVKKYMRYRVSRPAVTDCLITSRAGKPMSAGSLNFVIKRLAQRVGITDTKVTPHTFRHTYATRFIQNGGKITALKEILGHTSIQTTMRYIHMTAKDIEREAFKADPLRGIQFASR